MEAVELYIKFYIFSNAFYGLIYHQNKKKVMAELEPENYFLHIIVPNLCPLSAASLFSAPYISLFHFVFFPL